jgi:hypothetical protein
LAKYLYSDLKYDDYLLLHHTKKLSILKDVVYASLGYKDEYLSVCSRILFYILEDSKDHPITLLTIQKKRYLQLNMLFDCNASLRELRGRLGNLKKRHIARQKTKANKKNKKGGKKGVYVLLDSEYKKKLNLIVEANKMTINAVFKEMIDTRFQSLPK